MLSKINTHTQRSGQCNGDRCGKKIQKQDQHHTERLANIKERVQYTKHDQSHDNNDVDEVYWFSGEVVNWFFLISDRTQIFTSLCVVVSLGYQAHHLFIL